uniref:Metalloendopeptidase n=1 Tax=Strongyloides venezuelensis TaxID=75913 RepID=A0A0K0F133_STRVS
MNISKSFHDFNFEYDREKRKVIGNELKRFPLPIPVYIDKRLHHWLIIQALRIIETETCIRFYLVDQIVRGMSGIQFRLGEKCVSVIGKSLGREFQNIFIADYCQTLGEIQHETLHALGIDHEHSRIDRDYYVSILLQNVDESQVDDFRITSRRDSNTFGLSYDYGSIMHYDMYSHSKNKKPTIIPKYDLYKNTIGQIKELTFLDIKTLNLLYCKRKCSSFMVLCHNSGYFDPNNCLRCKCVEGFAGYNCLNFVENIPICGKSKYVAQYFPQKISARGIISCKYYLMTQKSARIMLKIRFTSIHPHRRKICSPTNSLEIKYWEDKAVTGARFCGVNKDVVFYSHGNTVIIYFRSTDTRNRFKLMFAKKK